MPQLGIGVVTSIAVSPDGRFAVTGSNTEAAVRLWDLEAAIKFASFKCMTRPRSTIDRPLFSLDLFITRFLCPLFLEACFLQSE